MGGTTTTSKHPVGWYICDAEDGTTARSRMVGWKVARVEFGMESDNTTATQWAVWKTREEPEPQGPGIATAVSSGGAWCSTATS